MNTLLSPTKDKGTGRTFQPWSISTTAHWRTSTIFRDAVQNLPQEFSECGAALLLSPLLAIAMFLAGLGSCLPHNWSERNPQIPKLVSNGTAQHFPDWFRNHLRKCFLLTLIDHTSALNPLHAPPTSNSPFSRKLHRPRGTKQHRPNSENLLGAIHGEPNFQYELLTVWFEFDNCATSTVLSFAEISEMIVNVFARLPFLETII